MASWGLLIGGIILLILGVFMSIGAGVWRARNDAWTTSMIALLVFGIIFIIIGIILLILAYAYWGPVVVVTPPEMIPLQTVRPAVVSTPVITAPVVPAPVVSTPVVAPVVPEPVVAPVVTTSVTPRPVVVQSVVAPQPYVRRYEQAQLRSDAATASYNDYIRSTLIDPVTGRQTTVLGLQKSCSLMDTDYLSNLVNQFDEYRTHCSGILQQKIRNGV